MKKERDIREKGSRVGEYGKPLEGCVAQERGDVILF
jgi:hypothetical protein